MGRSKERFGTLLCPAFTFILYFESSTDFCESLKVYFVKTLVVCAIVNKCLINTWHFCSCQRLCNKFVDSKIAQLCMRQFYFLGR